MIGFQPCPFCGSTDVSRSWQSASCIAIECKDCEATGPARRGDSTQEAKDGARDAWNTRVSPWRSLGDDPMNLLSTYFVRGTNSSNEQVHGVMWFHGYWHVASDDADYVEQPTIELAKAASPLTEYMEVPL